jgi:rSAM/selenodomain-associated transferase 2
VKISIIIPVLNEAEQIVAFLQPLQILRAAGHEVILVDGQSEDQTCDKAQLYVDKIIVSAKGRARQQIAGTRQATGQIYLFLHADTLLPRQADSIIQEAVNNGYQWGRFNVRLSGTQWLFRLIESSMNLRSCLTGIATGDQAIFLTRDIYYSAGGIPDIALMEDIEFSKRLRNLAKPYCCKIPVITSSRRWEQKGIIKTVFLMWSLRLQYFFGVKAEKLVKKYYS